MASSGAQLVGTGEEAFQKRTTQFVVPISSLALMEAYGACGVCGIHGSHGTRAALLKHRAYSHMHPGLMHTSGLCLLGS